MTSLSSGQRVVVSELGETPLEAIEKYLSLEPMPTLDPAALAPGDVLIAVKSAAVGWVDLIMTSGQYQHVPKPPYTPGLEYSGVVVAAGAEAAGQVTCSATTRPPTTAWWPADG
jgi:NADPH:quinone reductase